MSQSRVSILANESILNNENEQLAQSNISELNQENRKRTENKTFYLEKTYPNKEAAEEVIDSEKIWSRFQTSFKT